MNIEYEGYNIIHDGTYGMKSIKSIGRGAIHKDLKGQFSTAREAMKAINRVISMKGVKNAEANSSN